MKWTYFNLINYLNGWDTDVDRMVVNGALVIRVLFTEPIFFAKYFKHFLLNTSNIFC